MSLATRPLALTVGDPAGIGPDVTLLAFAARDREAIPPFIFLGDSGVLEARAKLLGLCIQIATVETPAQAVDVFRQAIPVLPVPVSADVSAGAPNIEAMEAVRRSIETAVALVQRGDVNAVVTNPVSKSHLYQAGFEFPGHTEYLAALVDGVEEAPHPVMMLAAGSFKVVPATIHIPLKAVAQVLSAELLIKTIRITDRYLRRFFALDRPRIAVSGLNPHAGEEGRLGNEEVDMIAPAIAAAREAGIDASGPYPADTMFHSGMRNRYDAAICMYHDQALVPFKTLAFDEGVNVTLGLPFIRTSPDHGTAFDIAGTGKANPRSLIEALRLADTMAKAATGQSEQ